MKKLLLIETVAMPSEFSEKEIAIRNELVNCKTATFLYVTLYSEYCIDERVIIGLDYESSNT